MSGYVFWRVSSIDREKWSRRRRSGIRPISCEELELYFVSSLLFCHSSHRYSASCRRVLQKFRNSVASLFSAESIGFHLHVAFGRQEA